MSNQETEEQRIERLGFKGPLVRLESRLSMVMLSWVVTRSVELARELEYTGRISGEKFVYSEGSILEAIKKELNL